MTAVSEGTVVSAIQHIYRYLILFIEPQIFRYMRIESVIKSNSTITVCEIKMSVPGKLLGVIRDKKLHF